MAGIRETRLPEMQCIRQHTSAYVSIRQHTARIRETRLPEMQ